MLITHPLLQGLAYKRTKLLYLQQFATLVSLQMLDRVTRLYMKKAVGFSFVFIGAVFYQSTRTEKLLRTLGNIPGIPEHTSLGTVHVE
jgi:hypothetical protein